MLTLEQSLDLKKAKHLALLNLQSQDARYRSRQKHSTHRPSNQWGAAGLPGRDWLIKEKENKQQGKGGGLTEWNASETQRNQEAWVVGAVGVVETKER